MSRTKEKKIYLINDKETYIAATSEIEGGHGLPIDITSFTNDPRKVLHDVGKQRNGNGIKPQSAQRYARRVIRCVNREDEETEGHRKN